MNAASDTAVILVAAGRGSRMGGGVPKQWRALADKPVIAHTIDAFRAAGLTRFMIAIHPDDRARAEALNLPLVDGGETRAQTVRNALDALADAPPDKVLIHDAARPLPPASLIAEVIAALDTHRAAAPGLPVTDALWRAHDRVVAAAHPREGLFRAQTPQGFHYDAIRDAHRTAPADAADDVEVARASGLAVWITPGSEENLKLTYPVDFERAEQILRKRKTKKGMTMDVRSGNGFDVHAFDTGDHVWLCGVRIPHSHSLKGHSDADVGMHALTDALYGALAEGDIGRHFPPSDPQWKGAASHIFLRHAATLARNRGFTLTSADVTLICEQPKIGPHADAMRAALAEILGADLSRVSVKATTSERLGFTGREEGIAAIATATLVSA